MAIDETGILSGKAIAGAPQVLLHKVVAMACGCSLGPCKVCKGHGETDGSYSQGS